MSIPDFPTYRLFFPSWMEPLGQIMKHVSERTPGSLVEVKTSSISFHYRECPVEFGERQANDLRCTLMSRANTLPVDIITGKKVVEVRCKGVSKGSMVRRTAFVSNNSSFGCRCGSYSISSAIPTQESRPKLQHQ